MSKLSPVEARTVEVYDETAATWSEGHSSLDFWAEEFQRFRGLLPTGKILEVGAGAGRDAELLTRAGYEYVGTDISAGLLRGARKHNPAAVFHQVSVYDLAENWQETFDGFWASAVLLHVPKRRINDALRSIRTTLGKSAIGFISLKQGTGEQIEADGRYFSYWQQPEFAATLAANGFSVKDYMYHPMSERTRWLCFFVERV
jgi:SAM-dependent methyltransferase